MAKVRATQFYSYEGWVRIFLQEILITETNCYGFQWRLSHIYARCSSYYLLIQFTMTVNLRVYHLGDSGILIIKVKHNFIMVSANFTQRKKKEREGENNRNVFVDQI